MKTAHIRFRRREDFLRYFLEDVYEGGLLWVSDTPVDLNEEIEVNIRFAGYPKQWTLKTFVVWRHAKPPERDDLPEGIGLAVADESLAELKELLKFCKERDSEKESLFKADERSEVRYEVPYLAEYLFDKRIIRAPLRDISESGCFIETDNPLPPQTRFVFLMYRPHKPRPWVMEGEVRWTRTEPPKKGMGIKLIFDTRRHKAEVKQLIKRIQSGGKDEPPPDESAYSTGYLKSTQSPSNESQP